jgi:3-oxoacyl-[acyl-carrier protein] reductase
MSPQAEEAQRRVIPLGRVGRPQDIADAIVSLASAQASWITGNVLKVSGGHEI